MKLLDPLHPIQSKIIEILARSPGISTADLHNTLVHTNKLTISIQNLYRLLSQLRDAHVIIRSKQSLSLNAKWCEALYKTAEIVRANYQGNPEGVMELPAHDGERAEFVTESLMSLEPLWDHIILQLINQTQTDTWYEFNAHPWHILGLPDTEQEFYQTIADKGVALKILVGNETFLDAYGAKLIASIDGVKATCSHEVPFPTEGYILMICDDYILECILPAELTRHFDRFFAITQSIDQFDLQMYSDIFRMKTRCKLTVRKSKDESNILRAKIEQFF